MILSDTPLYSARIDRNGANLRSLIGTFVRYLPPNAHVSVFSKPETIAGWRNRVVINRDTGHNILVDRLLFDMSNGLSLAWPTEHRVVTQRYGARPEYYRRWGLAGHEGIDLRAPTGTKIVACASGNVSLVSSGGNYGNQVRIHHIINGRHITTVYAHLERILVKNGDAVMRGQQIGTADSTGNAQGSHLHLSLYEQDATANRLHRNNGYGGMLDPAPWLGM